MVRFYDNQVVSRKGERYFEVMREKFTKMTFKE